MHHGNGASIALTIAMPLPQSVTDLVIDQIRPIGLKVPRESGGVFSPTGDVEGDSPLLMTTHVTVGVQRSTKSIDGRRRGENDSDACLFLSPKVTLPLACQPLSSKRISSTSWANFSIGYPVRFSTITL